MDERAKSNIENHGNLLTLGADMRRTFGTDGSDVDFRLRLRGFEG